MKLKSLVAALVIALVSTFVLAPVNTMAASPSTTGSKLLKNMKVTGDLEDGRTFKGMVTVDNLSYDEEEGLLMSGVVKGEAVSADGTTTDVKETFESVPATLTEDMSGDTMQAAALAQEECDLLNLDLGPIFLDLLGLQLDLSEINLDLTAVPGPGNLLGNLLCAVAGLLDGNGFLTGLFDEVSGLLNSLLDQINSLLG
ncbi:hypothetical protein [Halobacillus sp. Marseille-Q1614]|uniref:hypothetical protein n=1 Tax=Halobacillus sp. Marseille-Q1614 TaxID=2709134 RepID=UPI00156F3322|nr:hypothetical protein [Halobacillus sp. Marseille-Q1614]